MLMIILFDVELLRERERERERELNFVEKWDTSLMSTYMDF